MVVSSLILTRIYHFWDIIQCQRLKLMRFSKGHWLAEECVENMALVQCIVHPTLSRPGFGWMRAKPRDVMLTA